MSSHIRGFELDQFPSAWWKIWALLCTRNEESRVYRLLRLTYRHPITVISFINLQLAENQPLWQQATFTKLQNFWTTHLYLLIARYSIYYWSTLMHLKEILFKRKSLSSKEKYIDLLMKFIITFLNTFRSFGKLS